MAEADLPAVEDVLAGRERALARLITHLERGEPGAQEIADRVLSTRSREPSGHVLLTGPAGAGKSSILREIVRRLRAKGERVAVLACDPASQRTGGALLGDRVRWPEMNEDDGVFVRSLATRESGKLVPAVVWLLADLCSVAGYDRVLIETVGAGQNAGEESGRDFFRVVVLAPGQGDEVQLLKAGLLEWADLLVVNKGDVPGAEAWARLARENVLLGETDARVVLLASAATGRGVDEIVAALPNPCG